MIRNSLDDPRYIIHQANVALNDTPASIDSITYQENKIVSQSNLSINDKDTLLWLLGQPSEIQEQEIGKLKLGNSNMERLVLKELQRIDKTKSESSGKFNSTIHHSSKNKLSNDDSKTSKISSGRFNFSGLKNKFRSNKTIY